MELPSDIQLASESAVAIDANTRSGGAPIITDMDPSGATEFWIDFMLHQNNRITSTTQTTRHPPTHFHIRFYSLESAEPVRNPIARCVLSQKGMCSDRPHLHSATRVSD